MTVSVVTELATQGLTGSVHSLDAQDRVLHAPDGTVLASVGSHHTTQKGTQLKTYELVTSGVFV